MNMTPLKDWILLERVPPDTMTKGGLHLPEMRSSRQEVYKVGIVLAIGPGKQNSKGEFHKGDVRVDDRVMYPDAAFIEEVGDDVLVRESAILAKVEEEELDARVYPSGANVDDERDAIAKIIKPREEAKDAAGKEGIEFDQNFLGAPIPKVLKAPPSYVLRRVSGR